MAIYTKQLDPVSLTNFILNVSTGAAFSGSFLNYLNNSGWMGNLTVSTTGNQNITGIKRFFDPVLVNYSGGSGAAPSALYVSDLVSSLSGSILGGFVSKTQSNDIISGFKTFTGSVQINPPTNTGHAVNLGLLTGASGILSSLATGISGSLSSIKVTGSNVIQSASFTGLGGTLVIYSGNQIFISGAAGGGGGSNTQVTGSAAISAPNFTGVGTTTLTYNGTYVLVSGGPATDTVLSGYLENKFIHRDLTADIISGLKTFTGALGVGVPTTTGHAVNLGYLTGASGVLQSAINNITGGNTTNIFNLSGITGNFVNMSFYFDEYNLTTGLNQIEAFVSRDFFFTGYAIGAINSGTRGGFSGSFYQRTTINTKINFRDISLNTGQFFTGVGGSNQIISGMNRVGLDIYSIGTGITGLSVGLFGVGY